MVSPVMHDAAIFLARIGIGIVVLAHGWQKLFTLGLDTVGRDFGQLGIPQPEISATVVAIVEVVAAVALIAGILTPLAGVLVFGLMLGALYFVHFGREIFVTSGGYELVVCIGVGALLIAAVGAGRFSLDHLLGRG